MNFFMEVSRKALKNPCSKDTLMGMLQEAHQNYLNNTGKLFINELIALQLLTNI